MRRENVGDKVHLRGLIEFSNICRCQCNYCGLRAPNKTIERYRIKPEDIVLYAKKAVEIIGEEELKKFFSNNTSYVL